MMKKTLLIIAAVTALAVSIVAVAVVGAQEGTPDAEKPADEFIAKTAENLGITVDELTAAMTNARFEMIDEAVADGKLTEEQAVKLKERIQEYGPLIQPHRVKDKHRACLGARFMVSAAATVLDMEAADLAEQLKSGQSLAAVAEAQGMSVDDFKAGLLAQVKTELDTKVADGKLAQERADKIYAGVEENIDRIVNATPDGDGPCHRKDRGPRPDGAPGFQREGRFLPPVEPPAGSES